MGALIFWGRAVYRQGAMVMGSNTGAMLQWGKPTRFRGLSSCVEGQYCCRKNVSCTIQLFLLILIKYTSFILWQSGRRSSSRKSVFLRWGACIVIISSGLRDAILLLDRRGSPPRPLDPPLWHYFISRDSMVGLHVICSLDDTSEGSNLRFHLPGVRRTMPALWMFVECVIKFHVLQCGGIWSQGLWILPCYQTHFIHMNITHGRCCS